jgi:hypothetical protein
VYLPINGDEMELATVDALKWLRSQPARFFPSGRPHPIHLLAFVMADVLELGGGSCTIRHQGEWWIVGSDVDWLDHSVDVPQLFGRVIAAPQHGQHSMRAEVLVAAFATSVWTTLRGVRTRIQGDEPPASVWEEVAPYWRTIVFRL